MIQSDAELKATREALINLEEAMLDLTRNRAKYRPGTFVLLMEPIAEQIRARRAEIDDYIGLESIKAPSVSSMKESITVTQSSMPASS